MAEIPTEEQCTYYRRNTQGSTFTTRLTKYTTSIPSLSGPHSVLIRVQAVSLNYRDVNILNGTNPWPTLHNGIPCSDAAGYVLAVGSDVVDFVVGDRVMPIFDQKNIVGLEQERAWLGGEIDGVLATHLVFDEEKLVKAPECLSYEEAACLPCAGVTAWSAVAVEGSMKSGMSVLVQGEW
jgi:NADPH:quinone reductase-like Zn-dependent oxidoreductase